MALQAIYRLNIARYIPINGSASFEDIAAAANVDSNVLRRILKYAMTNFIFREEPPGVVRHSLLSKRLAEDPTVQGAVGMLVDESFPGSVQVCRFLVMKS